MTPITAPQPVATGAGRRECPGRRARAAAAAPHVRARAPEPVTTTREGGRRAVRASAALPGPLVSRVRDSWPNPGLGPLALSRGAWRPPSSTSCWRPPPGIAFGERLRWGEGACRDGGCLEGFRQRPMPWRPDPQRSRMWRCPAPDGPQPAWCPISWSAGASGKALRGDSDEGSHDAVHRGGQSPRAARRRSRRPRRTAKQASVSRADPSAVLYRTVRTLPNEPLPSAMLSTTLLDARRSCRPRSGSRACRWQ